MSSSQVWESTLNPLIPLQGLKVCQFRLSVSVLQMQTMARENVPKNMRKNHQSQLWIICFTALHLLLRWEEIFEEEFWCNFLQAGGKLVPLRQVVRKLGGSAAADCGKLAKLLQNESEQGRGGPRVDAPETFSNIYLLPQLAAHRYAGHKCRQKLKQNQVLEAFFTPLANTYIVQGSRAIRKTVKKGDIVPFRRTPP